MISRFFVIFLTTNGEEIIRSEGMFFVDNVLKISCEERKTHRRIWLACGNK